MIAAIHASWKFGDRFENVGEGNWLLHAYWVRIVVWENEA
jgi:hypothetical protein